MDIDAFGDADEGGQASNNTFQATADPTITIDPSFAYTADFALELSPNIPAAVPEPGTTGLMLIGVGLLGLVMRKRIAQGGHHEAVERIAHHRIPHTT